MKDLVRPPPAPSVTPVEHLLRARHLNVLEFVIQAPVSGGGVPRAVRGYAWSEEAYCPTF